MKQPKGLVYRAEYEPDMTRMVRALRVLLEYPKGGESSERTSPDCPRQLSLAMVPDGNEHRKPGRVCGAGVVGDAPVRANENIRGVVGYD